MLMLIIKESEIIVKGKFGTLQTKIPDEINIVQIIIV
jgi:hypothetical protein